VAMLENELVSRG